MADMPYFLNIQKRLLFTVNFVQLSSKTFLHYMMHPFFIKNRLGKWVRQWCFNGIWYYQEIYTRWPYKSL